MPSRRLRRSISTLTISANRTRAAAGLSGRRPSAPGLPVGRRLRPREAQRGAPVEGRPVAAVAVLAQVEVVDDLDHELVEVLDQSGPGVGVTGDTERAQHELAELVGGGDRRRRRTTASASEHPLRSRSCSSAHRPPARNRRNTSSPTAAGSASARSAATSWLRTRSRSSWLAIRPNVMTSISSSVAIPSAT